MLFSTEPRSEVVKESQRGAVGTSTNRKMIKTVMLVRPGTLSVAALTTEFVVRNNKEIGGFRNVSITKKRHEMLRSDKGTAKALELSPSS